MRAVLLSCLLLIGCAAPAVSGDPDPVASVPATAATTPSPSAMPSAVPATSEALQEAVSAAAILVHLQALAAIALDHGGNRAAGTAGFEASVAYVAGRLAAAGYEVRKEPFPGGTNVLAELPGTDAPDWVVVGAHLDSAAAGPGINDNGSGVATVLALAEAMTGFDAPALGVRFAFWGAEEIGHLGSEAHVAALGEEERERIVAYLNLDIVGSPNALRLVYDEPGAAAGSNAITALFADHFEALGLAWEPVDLGGKSDHGAFREAGIPTGGLFSGGTEPVTDGQAAAFGASPGQPADGCIHLACDTIERINPAALVEMADALAHALATLAQ